MINYLTAQKNWQTQLSEAISDINELSELLELPELSKHSYQPNQFKLRVPRSFVAKMQLGNINDPLLKQILPNPAALQDVSGYVNDPLAEQQQNPHKGILHKYQSRVLVTVTGACAIHCRYCFRQHFDYNANNPGSQIDKVISYIKQHPDINEVILSGGDPLNLNNRRLFLWLDSLSGCQQITTIRIHTRLPIVIPERLESELLEKLENINQHCHIVMVIHCNHANEIDDNTMHYLQLAKQTGITLLNQAVILAGINDDADTQVALCKRLFAAGVLPYYLHILDKVTGAAYFDIPEKLAIEIYWKMLAILPGYLMPKLVKELPNQPYKTPVNIYQNKS